MSRTVFDQFGVANDGPDSAVDIGPDPAHLHWVDTHAVIASLTPAGHGPAESAGPVATSSGVHGAAAAAAPSMVPGTPRHRRVAGTASFEGVSVVQIPSTVAVPAPGRNRVSAGRVGGADSAPPFANVQVVRSRTRYGTGQPWSGDWVNHVAKAAPQTRQYSAPAWPSGTLTGS